MHRLVFIVMQPTIDDLLEQAINAHKTGKLQEAQQLYLTILETNTKHPDANHNLGILEIGLGKNRDALHYLKIALDANPKKEPRPKTPPPGSCPGSP